jgi:transposase InsO family protein
MLCYPLTLRDAASRKVLAIDALVSTQWVPVRVALERCFREFGLPLEFQTDLGAPFGARGLARLSKLSVWLLKLNVLPLFGRPAKPQDNGAHERMHKDLKAEATRPPAHSLSAQQRKFDRFRQVFNAERPHAALDGDVPDDRWKPSPRSFPKEILPPEYPAWWSVRRVNRVAGTISWHDKTLKLGAAFTGEDIAFEPIDDGVFRVHFYCHAIGILDERGKRPVLLTQLKPKAA